MLLKSYVNEKEKILIRRLYLDFGNPGVDFFHEKMKFASIKSFSEIEEEVQLRFIFGLCEELYEDILSKKKLKFYVLEILLSMYDKYLVFSFLFWKDFFKGTPPINFIYHFFGKEIGNQLCIIHENKTKLYKISHTNDILQFSFVISLIYNLTYDNEFIRKSLLSHFTKYLMYGEGRSLKLKGFMNLNKNSKSNQFFSDINSYLINSYEIDLNNNKNKSFEVIDTLQNLIKSSNEENEFNISLKKIDINEIILMIGRYIGKSEAKIIVHNATRSLGIKDINFCENYTKKNFVDFIIEKSEIKSYSKQKQKMIKTLLFMLLKM